MQGRKGGHLSLVTEEGSVPSAGAAHSSFDIVALGELSKPEQRKVERAVASIAPHAAVIGVQTTTRSWDIRPVVKVSEDQYPSLIRFLGPEVSLSTSITDRTEELLNKLNRFKKVARISRFRAFGTFEGQLWYRRDVADSTLSALIDSGHAFSLSQALEISRELVRGVERLHGREIVHGHVTTTNVALSPEGEVFLLDSGVGLSVVQASNALGLESFPDGYQAESFAPEVIEGEPLSPRVDVYGVGVVLQQLFSNIEGYSDLFSAPELKNSDSGLRKVIEMIDAMAQANPARRPPLHNVSSLLGEKRMRMAASGETIEQPTAKRGDAQGRVTANRAKRVQIKTRDRKEPAREKVEQTAPREVFSPSDRAVERVTRPDVALPGVPRELKPTPPSPQVRQTVDVGHRSRVREPGGEESRGTRTNLGAQTQALRPQETHEFERAKPTYDQPPQPQRRSTPTEELGQQRVHTQPPRSNLNLYLFLSIMLAVGVFWYRSNPAEQELPPTQFDQRELELAWYSKRPSLMVSVAEAALNRNSPDEFAELLIVKSAMNGDLVSNAVDIPLLRVAFDSRWERELTEEDKRLALALALSALLKDRTPRDLPALDTVHPGVLLAITASAGDNVSAFLRDVPVSILEQLPPPFGPAFVELGRSGVATSCGDKPVRLLARFATRGIEDSLDVMQFVETNPRATLRTLAQLYAHDTASARKTLDIVLDHPNLEVRDPIVAWANEWRLTTWNEISSADQLFILAGIAPSGQIAAQHLGMMFAHPLPEMRRVAIRRGLESIRFEHKGAYPALRLIAQSPEQLTADQTMSLGRFLESPIKASSGLLQEWFETKPPVAIVGMLLVASSDEIVATKFDFESSRYLQRENWAPSYEALKKLVNHPDNLTRLYAYTRTFSFARTHNVGPILERALQREKIPKFREQLRLMLDGLRSSR